MSSQSFPTAFVALALGGLSLAALATSQGSGGPVNVTPEDIAPEALVQAPDSVCALSFEPSGSGALLSASVHPEATMSGTYALTVTRQSGGNRSSIRQGGVFLAPGGELTVLSLSSFGGMAGVEANLTITANGQVFDCAYPAYPLSS